MLGWGEDTNRWPDDAEFRIAWLDHKVYNLLALARLRMILLALEPYVRSAKSEDLAYVEDKLTVEHLLPQKWQKHYPLAEDGSADEIERERLLHTFGNLTLLTKKLNSSVSNGPWRTAEDLADDRGKRAALLKDAALGISRMLVDYPAWDDKTIRKRGETLFAAALKVWPKPFE
ncbi:MAG: HNH endonuclease family protein [Coriobacteriia bacterium]|nr:HNH endonuclease family protein [Coriobacteriia bacterium]